jgi:hypothetical protein
MALQIEAYKNIAAQECEKPIDDRETFWFFWMSKQLNTDIGSWYQGAQYIALIQPSSGSSERAFSLAESLFDHTQTSALEDMKEAAVMIRANNNWRQAEKTQLVGN